MTRTINPLIDCVFKALFATEEHRHLLIDLLNSLVQPDQPIVEVEYLDRSFDPDRLDGRGTSVDVKVRDSLGHLYQVEVQVVLHPAMAERMAATWSRMYTHQLERGDSFSKLLPVTSVWIMDRPFGKDDQVHRHFALRDPSGQLLTEHCNIHILELAKLPAQDPATPHDSWLYFLRESRDWEDLPPGLQHPALMEAMQVMRRFAQDESEYYRYMAEVDAERVQLDLELGRAQSEKALADALVAKKQALDEKKQALDEKKQALDEKKQALDEKKQALDEKKQALDEKKQALDALAAKEAELARLRALLGDD